MITTNMFGNIMINAKRLSKYVYAATMRFYLTLDENCLNFEMYQDQNVIKANKKGRVNVKYDSL